MSPKPASSAASAEFAVTLDEWAVQSSTSDRRVELLNAFITEERQAGRLRDTPSGFAARYKAFAERPVK